MKKVGTGKPHPLLWQNPNTITMWFWFKKVGIGSDPPCHQHHHKYHWVSLVIKMMMITIVTILYVRVFVWCKQMVLTQRSVSFHELCWAFYHHYHHQHHYHHHHHHNHQQHYHHHHATTISMPINHTYEKERFDNEAGLQAKDSRINFIVASIAIIIMIMSDQNKANILLQFSCISSWEFRMWWILTCLLWRRASHAWNAASEENQNSEKHQTCY